MPGRVVAWLAALLECAVELRLLEGLLVLKVELLLPAGALLWAIALEFSTLEFPPHAVIMSAEAKAKDLLVVGDTGMGLFLCELEFVIVLR